MTNGGTNGHGDLCNCEGCQWLYRFSVTRDVPHLPIVKQAESGKVCKCGVPLQTKTALRTGLCRECRDKGETYGLGEDTTNTEITNTEITNTEIAGTGGSGTWECRITHEKFTPDLAYQPAGKSKNPKGTCWCPHCKLHFTYPGGSMKHKALP